MQTTFFYLERHLKKLADDQCSLRTKGSIYHTKHMYIQSFTTVLDWAEIWCLMEVSTMFYICRYCVFIVGQIYVTLSCVMLTNMWVVNKLCTARLIVCLAINAVDERPYGFHVRSSLESCKLCAYSFCSNMIMFENIWHLQYFYTSVVLSSVDERTLVPKSKFSWGKVWGTLYTPFAILEAVILKLVLFISRKVLKTRQ